jgi:hypothetical protein
MTQKTEEQIISEHMSAIATKRWRGKTKKQRSEHMRMMGQESGKARKPRRTRAN